MKFHFPLLLVAFFVSTFSFSQTQGVAYPAVGKGVATTFVTDYHCLGINSSALGWGTGFENKRFTTGTSEFVFGIYSDNLTSQKLKNLSNTLWKQINGNANSKMDWNAQKEEAARYAEAGLSIQLNFNWAGFSFQNEKFGGIAFNVRESYQWDSKLSQQTSDLIFRGSLSSYFDSLTVVFGMDTSKIANDENLSQDTLSAVIQGSISVPLQLSKITKGSDIRLSWTRTYNLGYGRKIFGNDSTFAFYGGIGGRLIQAMAMFDMHSDEQGLRVSSSITSGFNINYGAVAQGGFQQFKGGFPPAVGYGYGLDLSASIILKKKLKVAASVNNLGSVSYKKNVYSVRDTLIGTLSLNGLADGNITEATNQLLQDGGLLNLEGEERFNIANAANFRFGASFHPWKWIDFGFDMVAPFNTDAPGSIQNAVYSFGGDIRPFKWLQLSAGYFGGGIYKNNVPLGINFILRDGGYEFGISSQDALSFFTKNSNTVSAAFGFARVRF